MVGAGQPSCSRARSVRSEDVRPARFHARPCGPLAAGGIDGGTVPLSSLAGAANAGNFFGFTKEPAAPPRAGSNIFLDDLVARGLRVADARYGACLEPVVPSVKIVVFDVIDDHRRWRVEPLVTLPAMDGHPAHIEVPRKCAVSGGAQSVLRNA